MKMMSPMNLVHAKTRSSSLVEHIIFTTSSYIEVLGFVPAVWSRGKNENAENEGKGGRWMDG